MLRRVLSWVGPPVLFVLTAAYLAPLLIDGAAWEPRDPGAEGDVSSLEGVEPTVEPATPHDAGAGDAPVADPPNILEGFLDSVLHGLTPRPPASGGGEDAAPPTPAVDGDDHDHEDDDEGDGDDEPREKKKGDGKQR